MATIDAAKEIRRAVDSGKVRFGFRQSEKSILKGDAQLVIISNNTQKRQAEKIRLLAKAAAKPVYEFKGTGLELGAVCGKPFVVSTMVIIDAGKSKVMDLAKEEKKRQ